jgi:hypothetical protein
MSHVAKAMAKLMSLIEKAIPRLAPIILISLIDISGSSAYGCNIVTRKGCGDREKAKEIIDDVNRGWVRGRDAVLNPIEREALRLRDNAERELLRRRDDAAREALRAREATEREFIRQREAAQQEAIRVRQNAEREWLRQRDEAAQRARYEWLRQRDEAARRAKEEWVRRRDDTVRSVNTEFIDRRNELQKNAREEWVRNRDKAVESVRETWVESRNKFIDKSIDDLGLDSGTVLFLFNSREFLADQATGTIKVLQNGVPGIRDEFASRIRACTSKGEVGCLKDIRTGGASVSFAAACAYTGEIEYCNQAVKYGQIKPAAAEKWSNQRGQQILSDFSKDPASSR